MNAIAVTEHGYLFSIVELHKECKKHGIKPIYGFEVYFCDDRETDTEHAYHLVILAKNEEGYHNLIRLASDAGLNKAKITYFKEGENGKAGRFKTSRKEYPRIDRESLRKFGKGLIGLSACLGGVIPRKIIDGSPDEVKEYIEFYQSVFDEFYLEVQPHSMADQIIVNSELVTLSQQMKIPLVMTSDYHYIDPSNKEYHDVLMAIAHRQPYTVSAHLRTTDEMESYCLQHHIPLTAITNTADIADSIEWIDITPKDPRGLMPPFPCPPGYTEESYLRKLSYDYLLEMAKKNTITDFKGYLKQTTYELDIICSMGFSGYFLILWDWFLWCRNNGILMGKGRGQLGLLGVRTPRQNRL